VADYSVDIAVALKGAKKLTDFNKTVDNTTKNIRALNHNLKTTSKDQKLVIKSFNKLNEVLSTAKSNFNSVASGTKLQTKAARQLIAAEKQLNREYNQRENLLNRLRGTGPMPLPGTGVGRDPVASSIARRRRKLMRGANQYSSPLGPFQASPLQMIPGFGMGSLQGQSSPVGDKIARALENEKRLVKEVEAIRGRASTRRINNTKRQLSLEKKSNDFIKKAIKEETALRKKAEDEANALAQKRRDRNRALRRRASGAISSGLIGGGFPLLFGQGPTAAIGGAAGGLLGGAIGGQAGFALSIAGTTIGQALEDLATALAKPTENIENLITKLGIAETPTAKLALRLEKLGLKSSAATLLLDEFEEKFGLTTGEIEENTKKMTDFKNKINELGTQITLFLSNSLKPFLDMLLKFTKTRNKEDTIIGLQRQLKEQIIGTGGDNKSFQIQNDLIKKAAQARRKEENLSFGEYQDVLANMYRTLLGFDMDKYISQSSKTNNTNNTLNNNLNPNLQNNMKFADEVFALNNILPLQQSLDIEKDRLKMTSAELNLQKEKNKQILLEKQLKVKIAEDQKLSTPLLKEEIDILKVKIKNQEQVVTNAETLLDIETLRNKASLTDLDNRIKLEQQRLNLLPKEIKILDQQNKLSLLKSKLVIAQKSGEEAVVNNLTKQIELQQILINQSMILANPIEAEMILLDQQLKQLLDTGNMVVGLSQTISSSFQNSFKGVITGTMTVTDAFRNMTSRISSYFLDMAAKIMATRVQQSILGLFNFGGGGGLFSSFVGNSSLTGAFSASAGGPSPLLGFRAGGGSVRGGGSYVVGERGPEMFTPGVSGTVTPNHALGGNTNIVVNVDASGTEVEGDEASSSQLGKLIGLAVQQELVKQSRAGGLLSRA